MTSLSLPQKKFIFMAAGLSHHAVLERATGRLLPTAQALADKGLIKITRTHPGSGLPGDRKMFFELTEAGWNAAFELDEAGASIGPLGDLHIPTAR